MNVKGKHIVVVGLARSGMAVARFLNDKGAHVTLTDKATEDILGSFAMEARQMNVGLELGRHRRSTFRNAELIVISPGVPHTITPLEEARVKGIPVIGEIELAGRFIQTPIVAVSGTNGKTTTTELVGNMLAASGLKVFVGGNIGNPLIEIADRSNDLDVIVAEISSFQLDTIDTFSPHVAVLLNISADHLDRYSDIDAYAASKRRLFENQLHSDFAICNANDPLVSQQCREIESVVLKFSSKLWGKASFVHGAVIAENQVTISLPETSTYCVDLNKTPLLGVHNHKNIAAASMAALLVGANIEGVQEAVESFHALPHRLEPVGSVNHIEFVNDSKATNVDAVVRALECFSHPVVLIMGGRNKGYDFRSLRHHVKKHVKKLVVIGEAGDEIIDTLGQEPEYGSIKAVDMAQAVQQAYGAAKSGETVLLSPACASFDMFGSYAERGDKFRQLVGELT